MEHPFYYDTVWDLWRLVDYLETRAAVDAKNIGMIGVKLLINFKGSSSPIRTFHPDGK